MKQTSSFFLKITRKKTKDLTRHEAFEGLWQSSVKKKSNSYNFLAFAAPKLYYKLQKRNKKNFELHAKKNAHFTPFVDNFFSVCLFPEWLRERVTFCQRWRYKCQWNWWDRTRQPNDAIDQNNMNAGTMRCDRGIVLSLRLDVVGQKNSSIWQPFLCLKTCFPIGMKKLIQHPVWSIISTHVTKNINDF